MNEIINFSFFLKNKYGRGGGQCNWQRIPDCRSLIKDIELLNISSTKMSSILRGNNLSFIMVNLVATKVEITKASRQKFMVIGNVHKCSNRKRINAIYVKNF